MNKNNRIYLKYSDRKAWANSKKKQQKNKQTNKKTDQLPHNVVFGQGLHCLPFIKRPLDASAVSRMVFLNPLC